MEEDYFKREFPKEKVFIGALVFLLTELVASLELFGLMEYKVRETTKALAVCSN